MRGRRRQGAKAVGSMGCDSRSGSLQRMVRRFVVSGKMMKKSHTRRPQPEQYGTDSM